MKKILILMLLTLTTVFTQVAAQTVIFNNPLTSTYPTPDSVDSTVSASINNNHLEIVANSPNWQDWHGLNYTSIPNVTGDFELSIDNEVTTNFVGNTFFRQGFVLNFDSGNTYAVFINDSWGATNQMRFDVQDITTAPDSSGYIVLYSSADFNEIGNATYNIKVIRVNGTLNFYLDNVLKASTTVESNSTLTSFTLTNSKLSSSLNSSPTKFNNLYFDYVPTFNYPADINLTSNYGDYFDANISYQDSDETLNAYPINASLAEFDSFDATAPTNVGDFQFDHWYDLDNDQIYTTSPTIDFNYNPQGNPRDFNLEARYSQVATETVQASIESGLTGNIVYTADTYKDETISLTQSEINETLPVKGVNGTQTMQFTLQAPVIEGYTFQHWYDLDNNEIYEVNRTLGRFLVRSLNLEARYSEIPEYQVDFTSNLPSPPDFEYSINDGALQTGYPVSLSLEENDTIEITAPTENIGFYEFDGWYNNFTNSIQYTTATIDLVIFQGRDLEARYSLPDEYQIDLQLSANIGNITFQIDNDTPIVAPVIDETIFEGQSFTAEPPTDSTYQFQHWYDLDNDEIFTTDFILNEQNVSRSYNLEARLVEVFNLTFDSAGGTPVTGFFALDGEEVDLPEPTREGFVFAGWYESDDPFAVVVNEPYTVTGDQEFTAFWIAIVTVSFNSNGGSDVPSQSVTASGLITEPAIPSRFGYQFQGWYLDNNTFANEYDFTQPIPFNIDFTLHAKWELGSDSDINLTLGDWVDNSGLPAMVIVITIMLAITVTLGVINAQMYVVIITNISLIFVFTSLGFIPIWVILVSGLAVVGFIILMLFGGRSNA